MLNDDEFLRVSKDIIKAAASISAPLWWLSGDTTCQRRHRNGSAFFLRTASTLFGVTAAHVVEGWKKDCKRNGYVPLNLTGSKDVTLEMDWGARVIASHPGIDVATFTITESEIAALGQSIFTDRPEPWPTKVGEWVSYCGYPAAAVRSLKASETAFGASTATGRLTTIDDCKLNIQIERDKLAPVLGSGLPPKAFNFGGISGGPVLRNFLTPQKQPWRVLGGVIIQGTGARDPSGQFIEDLELVTARRACFVNPDGTLDIARWENLP